MSIEPCELHEIINCGVCKPKPKEITPTVSPGAGKFATPRPISYQRTFRQAAYEGWCRDGDHRIEVGDLITRSPDDQGWNCEEHT